MNKMQRLCIHLVDVFSDYVCVAVSFLYYPGKVTYAEVKVDSDGKSHGRGFVQFEETDEALKAVGEQCCMCDQLSIVLCVCV